MAVDKAAEGGIGVAPRQEAVQIRGWDDARDGGAQPAWRAWLSSSSPNQWLNPLELTFGCIVEQRTHRPDEVGVAPQLRGKRPR